MSDPLSETVVSDPTLDRLRRMTMGITAGRLAGAFLLAWLIHAGHMTLAFWLLLLIGLGALLEGFAALVFKTRTRIGAALDGLADRLVPLLALIVLASANLIPYWVLIPVLLRELVLLLGQKLPESAGNLPWIREPRWLFHVNIVALDLLVLLILLIQGPGFGFDAFLFPLEMLVVALAAVSLLLAFLRRPGPAAIMDEDKGEAA
ncbi:CDP-alcohol phosphatidyltransferase family protein [Niveispirillum fermenti]|uniref:CDP-alcohol phosphatidyltransferase family protein n=1 Tax=Niveispirillum fermenti TaxID=1233113 RepID=UPI003A89B916